MVTSSPVIHKYTPVSWFIVTFYDGSIVITAYITDYNDFNQICEELDTKLDPNIFAFAGYMRPSHLC